jgi:hypothetical protein
MKREIKSHFPGGRTLDGFTAQAYREAAEWALWHTQPYDDTRPYTSARAGMLVQYLWSAKPYLLLHCSNNRDYKPFIRMYHWLIARAEFAEAQERARKGGGR